MAESRGEVTGVVAALEQLVLMAPLEKESVFQPRKVSVSLFQTKWLLFLRCCYGVAGQCCEIWTFLGEEGTMSVSFVLMLGVLNQ